MVSPATTISANHLWLPGQLAIWSVLLHLHTTSRSTKLCNPGAVCRLRFVAGWFNSRWNLPAVTLCSSWVVPKSPRAMTNYNYDDRSTLLKPDSPVRFSDFGPQRLWKAVRTNETRLMIVIPTDSTRVNNLAGLLLPTQRHHVYHTVLKRLKVDRFDNHKATINATMLMDSHSGECTIAANGYYVRFSTGFQFQKFDLIFGTIM